MELPGKRRRLQRLHCQVSLDGKVCSVHHTGSILLCIRLSGRRTGLTVLMVDLPKVSKTLKSWPNPGQHFPRTLKVPFNTFAWPCVFIKSAQMSDLNHSQLRLASCYASVSSWPEEFAYLLMTSGHNYYFIRRELPKLIKHTYRCLAYMTFPVGPFRLTSEILQVLTGITGGP